MLSNALLVGMISASLGALPTAAFDSQAAARLFVSACLDGKAVLPRGAVEVDRADAGMPAYTRLSNARYYKLVPGRPYFLRIADDTQDKDFDRFCELRGKQLQLKVVWPVVAAAVDPRLDRNPTANIDFYEIDYPAVGFKVSMHPQFLLVEHYRANAAIKRKKQLPVSDGPNVTRTDLPY
jgi:hypothetical protein